MRGGDVYHDESSTVLGLPQDVFCLDEPLPAFGGLIYDLDASGFYQPAPLIIPDTQRHGLLGVKLSSHRRSLEDVGVPQVRVVCGRGRRVRGRMRDGLRDVHTGWMILSDGFGDMSIGIGRVRG